MKAKILAKFIPAERKFKKTIVARRANFAGTKFGGGKRGRAKIPSPQPPSFLPARAFRIVCAARCAAMGQFLSKKVRAKCIITAQK
ncbi:hypothetical protein A3G98_00325 [Candidatus Nomurabacteria bacterium RIFCSPLOWO2_12_FULL_37_8]|uniref:Uncharacterized protein n=1 Tax=Candidatus Nomurabacteria bacterium RIFCSPLOWO2_12_FULL_37_8 TaxID=1801793 RepID=A0A1F6Y2U0_9BACT|nr:MAG: hypothetical protein A3G98_00325 [Candidatus Nomurabacteria bacterium RIFCSPLOWO2_12_FULL_37_8]